MPKMLRLNGLTEYWEGLSGKIWNVEDDGTTCDILIQKSPTFWAGLKYTTGKY